MIKDKVVKVFDVDNITIGDVVAYCYTDVADDGETVDGEWKNGLVSHVAERTLTLTTVKGVNMGITISDIETDRVRVISVHEQLNGMIRRAADQEAYLKLD